MGAVMWVLAGLCAAGLVALRPGARLPGRVAAWLDAHDPGEDGP